MPTSMTTRSTVSARTHDWEHVSGERFADLTKIHQPTLVVNGIHDEMIPVSNSYALGEHLPNAVLLTYPESGHGSLFQFHESFTQPSYRGITNETYIGAERCLSMGSQWVTRADGTSAQMEWRASIDLVWSASWPERRDGSMC